jgi:uncharacterized protein (TIGR03435 family)
MLGKPVVDKTGLTGSVDMDLKWAPVDLKAQPAVRDAEPDESPSLFTAVQEQLGFRLVLGKEPFDVVVIDSMARPTAN